MSKVRLSVLALASVVVPSILHAQFADGVVAYEPGTGATPGYTDPATALGEPSRETPGMFGGPVDPFNPPYLSSQIVSIGEGGSLTLKFNRPVLNHLHNEFGLDFIIYGNNGFIITNEFSLETFDWIGEPATDGSTFGSNDGETRVSVSADGSTFYQLNPAIAPTVDGALPTDGGADFHTSADPTLTSADFAGATIDVIRALFYGSAGGAGYDISWAQDASGQSVRLPLIRYVRIDVISGKSEVDGVAAVFAPTVRR